MPEIILGLIIGAVVFVVAFSISKLFASSPRAAIAGSLMVIAALIGFIAPASWLLVLVAANRRCGSFPITALMRMSAIWWSMPIGWRLKSAMPSKRVH